MRILFRLNRFSKTDFYVVFSKSLNIVDRKRFRGLSNKCEHPLKLPISVHNHIKDYVNMVNATIWSLFMFQWHLMTLFHFNILQDVERECLIQLNVCLINLLDIYSVLLIIFHGHSYIGKFTLKIT